MKLQKFLTVCAFLFLSTPFLKSQVPFNKGVNLTNWFQTSNVRQIQFSKYSKKDFENIKSLGCDVIRLPINLHCMTSGAPNYTIDPLFFEFLDQAVNWAEELKIYLLLDNHSTDDVASKSSNLETTLTKVWQQMAEHYKDRSSYILYEIMNEPNGLTTAKWGSIQQSAINAIRAIDKTHTLVVGASNFNAYTDMTQLPVYTDANLIYTFHFYDPFIFTHQGASWPSPSMTTLTKVPYPYNASAMPVFPSDLKGTWLENQFNNFNNEGTVTKIKQLIDIAVAFKNSRNVNIYCGEFGVYNPYSVDSCRVKWYADVRNYLDEKKIPWTIWDYQGTFGLFKVGSNEMFDYNLNIPLVKALGFNAPAQKIDEPKADSTGFSIYNDFIGSQIVEASNAIGGKIDFYSNDKPNNGKRCLSWTGSGQYGQIGFNFVPDKDLSKLVNDNYALSFLVRGNSPGTKIEVRFTDTKTTEATDHPWRMNYTIDESIAKWDNKWHSVYIPLKNFADQGSWDNSWYEPIGAFNWKAVDRFDIVTDQGALTNKVFWFDNITVVNKDTAMINDTTTFVFPTISTSISSDEVSTVSIYPNPAKSIATISFSTPNESSFDISIYDTNGRLIRNLGKSKRSSGELSVNWNLVDNNGKRVANGLYFCRVLIQNQIIISKIMVMN